MKNKNLSKPLILSVLILFLLSMLVYLIAGHSEGSTFSAVISSIGMLFMGIIRATQWLIAMSLALAVCLAFLFAIFLGAVALFNKDVSASMFNNLKTTLFGWLPQCTTENNAQKCCPSTKQSATEEQYNELNKRINQIKSQLETTQQALTEKLGQLSARIDSLEATAADMATKQQLDDVENRTQGAMSSLPELQSTVSEMKDSIEQTAGQLQDLSPATILGDLPQRIQAVEEQQNEMEIPEPVDITPLQDDINAIQTELSQLKEKASSPATQATAASTSQSASASSPVQEAKGETEVQEEHRIFSYFDDQADKEKLVALVSSTLDKDMSYKHVLNFLVKEFGPVKGKIISSHPSLSKDYIRQCRKNH